MIRDARDFSVVTTLDTHDCQGGVAFSPDGAYLMTANLELFSTKSWQRLASFATTSEPDATPVTVARASENPSQGNAEASCLRRLKRAWRDTAGARH